MNGKFEIKAVYGVFLMNFIIDKNIKLRTDVILSDRETGELFSDKFREIFIALPLFNKNEEECETNFERWIYILNNMETLKRMPFKARKSCLRKSWKISLMWLLCLRKTGSDTTIASKCTEIIW